MNKVTISKCCKMAMIKKGINSEEMAEVLKLTEPTVASYRAGNIRDVEKLAKFAEACDMNFREMMGLAE